MGDAKHFGTKQVVELVKLPKGWTCQDGLEYPLVIVKGSGLRLTFYCYQEHHEYIQQLFRPDNQ